MQINIPNIPNLFGKVIGKVVHVPVDVFQGVKQGFVAAGKPDEHEDTASVEQPAPTNKPSFAKKDA